MSAPCSVTELNRYINSMFKRDATLSDIWVKGEISNFRPHYSGHLYFTLKDESSAIRCVMFRSAASRMRFALENGMKALILGSVSVFERDGQYQLYCEEIRGDGVGDLYVAFERLKRSLESEGLFDASRKKPLPMIPRAVCVLTSPTGSVVHDIINVATRRFPKAVVKIFPVKVQGEGAAAQVARAIRIVNERRLADAIIVARGGGSIEELWAFNEEAVARAVAASGIPVISAVGHETDFTICDFAADVRAPTPSAAAEIAFPDAGALAAGLESSSRLLRGALMKRLERSRARLRRCEGSYVFKKPLDGVGARRMRLAMIEDRLAAAMRSAVGQDRARVAILASRLDALSPLAVLARGYAVVADASTGRVLRRAADAHVGQAVNVRLSEGSLACEVKCRG